jgi:hypothetical protein
VYSGRFLPKCHISENRNLNIPHGHNVKSNVLNEINIPGPKIPPERRNVWAEILKKKMGDEYKEFRFPRH